MRKKAVVVVLGDIGRSPRMCYHAYSLATQLNYDVTMVGYLDSTPHHMLTSNKHIRIVPTAPPYEIGSLPEVMQMAFKLIWTTICLFFTLLFRTPWSVELFLMQNPPAIPTMPVCWLMAKLKGSKFVIDWHNYMFSVLRDKYGLTFSPHEEPQEIKEIKDPMKELNRRRREEKYAPPTSRKKKPPMEKKEEKSTRQQYVEWVYGMEKSFGQMAHAGLCVTKAMRQDLATNWGINAAVFYDRPPSWTFGNATIEEKHDLFMRLGSEYPVFHAMPESNENRFTRRDPSGKVSWLPDRPMIVMSSTSWTPDEDFSILLEAVQKYNDVARLIWSDTFEKRLPSILLVITGRGPMKEFYLEKIARLNMSKVEVITPWLEAADYPRLLAAANLGVSLHTSTSGLDLPMKVVDMFGSGLPALAKKFSCIAELVVEGQNGHLFDTSNELADHLIRLGTGFPFHCKDLDTLKATLVENRLESWEENWATNAMNLLAPERNIALERVLANEPSDSESSEE